MPSLEHTSPGILAPSLRNPPANLRFRLVTDFRELQALAPDWQKLLDQSPSPEPMRSPDWLLTWWQVYGPSSGRSLRVGLFHDGEHLVGMAPLCARRFWYRPGIPMTRLEFLGADANEPDGVCSEYLNLILRAGREEQVIDAFSHEVLRGAFGRWHELVLDAMNGDEATPEQIMTAFERAGCRGDKQTWMDAPYLPLPESWDAYLKSLTSSKRRYVLKSWRDFEAWAGTDWKMECVRTPAELPAGQKILRQLHSERWQQGEGISGAFARERFTAFHDAVMPTLLREGRLVLFWVTVRDEPIAVSYLLRANSKLYFYQSGRKLDLPASVRPGIITTILAIQQALTEGLREYDFLGGVSQYKAQFSKTTRPLVCVRIARNGPREWLRRGAERVIDCGRRLRNAYRQWRTKPADPTPPAAESVNQD